MSFIQALSRYPLFALMGQNGLAAWLAEAEALSVETGQTLTRAGERGEYAYLVIEGRVRVLTHSKSGREVILGAFAPGEVFGEYALLPPHIDSATCRVAEPGRVLRLPLAPLKRTIAGQLGVGATLKNWLRLHAVIAHLRAGASLGFVSASSVLTMLDRCVEETCPAQHTVQSPGLCDDSWFYLRTGEVQLNLSEGPPRKLSAGDCFGERGLFGRGRLPSATTLVDSVLLRLSRSEFETPITGTAPSLVQTVNEARQPAPDALEWIAQRTPSDCGLAALAMAARRAGLTVSWEQIAKLLPVAADGTSLEALRQTAQRIGLSAAVAMVAPIHIRHIQPPAVLHTSSEHYVALLDCSAGSVVLGDPASGIATKPIAELMKEASGAVLLLAKK